MKRNGQILDVSDVTNSRRALRVTTQDYGVTRVTLMPGVLGTDEGLAVVDRASDLERLVFDTPRRSARDQRKG